MQSQNDARGRKHFTISVAGSTTSSRSASPAPSFDEEFDEKFAPKGEYDDPQSTDVYDIVLPWWRAAIRRKLVERVHLESKIIAKLQPIVRRPWLDLYFVYTSLAGSHTFFMVMLPAFAFFGHENIARDLIIVLASGVYLSSVMKDLFCAPRPFAPPVTRLTIGSFHLEYGFPSTHTTNGVSIALFFFVIAHQLTYTPTASITPLTLSIISGALIFYTFSIVFGRIYTAMHSFTDCVMGAILGTGIWWGHTNWAGHPFTLSTSNPLTAILNALDLGKLVDADQYLIHVFPGLGGGDWMENWARTGGWEVPLILIPLVVLGATVGLWGMKRHGIAVELNGPSIMPGSGWVRDAAGLWLQVERTWGDVAVWWMLSLLKMATGILAIFVWRIVAKSALHLILPPTFRLLSKAFSLPNRRFYIPATEYKNVPSEFHVGEDGTIELHAIPSVIDLPSSAGVMVETGGIGSGVSGSSHRSPNNAEMKMRSVNGSGTHTVEAKKHSIPATSHSVRFGSAADEELHSVPAKDSVKHYDAEVLTKVIVYAGIAFIACEVMPLFFEASGWGLRSSP
ncbi:sphingosine-1-phosphate phosphatase [Ephemerocybe angulata]|uniref:Sphingosine-1-phosphate phosphatase n=1 Tax=Ephemerocybe angulata TaxID=980116 RepID=A0A8H6HV16_9AGAR|nr:sphingosine-1-phosphate phosphatase [Tulosesus angulatus]